MIQYMSMTVAALLLLAQPAFTAEQYVDVHVHLRGTTKSGMLGNINNKPGMGGHKGLRPTLQTGRQSSMRGGRQSGQHGPHNSRAENLKIAAENMIQKMATFGVQQALVVVVPGPNPEEDEYVSMRKVVGEYPGRLKLLAWGERLSPYLQNMPPEKVTDTDRVRFRQIATQILSDGAVGFGEMISYHLSMAKHTSNHSIAALSVYDGPENLRFHNVSKCC